jgi:hypothetical protein
MKIIIIIIIIIINRVFYKSKQQWYTNTNILKLEIETIYICVKCAMLLV